MVKIGLQIKATLENVEELKTTHSSYTFFIKIKCTNCGESSDKWHTLAEDETTHCDSRNPDGFNFYMKCKLCSRENSIDVLEGSHGWFTVFLHNVIVINFFQFSASYTVDDSEKFKTIAIFDCRGVEPTDFSPRIGWIVKSAENGPTFDNVDLSDDDWVEYDQKNSVSIGIYSFENNFVKLKQK